MVCKIMKKIFGSDKPLLCVELDGFMPLTSRDDRMTKKLALRDKLRDEISFDDIREFREKYGSSKLSLKVSFSLPQSNMDGDTQKDLDNLLKPLLDVLADTVAKPNKSEDYPDNKGLGLIPDDKYIFHLDCKKKILPESKVPKIDLKIYKYSDD